MEHHDAATQQSTLWWITSLAISVTCCAILFVVFAGYVVGMKEELAVSRLRYDMADQRIGQLNAQVEMLYRRVVIAPVMAPPAAASSAVTPPAAGETTAPAVETTPTLTPPATAPAAVPEVPGK